MYPSVHGHLGCFQFLGIRNHSAMNIHVQVLVWSWFIYVFTSVPQSHVPSHIGNRSSLHNVYLLFYVFMINVCSSCVRAFLIYTCGGIMLQSLFCTFFTQLCGFGIHLCCHEHYIWSIVPSAVGPWAMDGLLPHFGPPLPLYCPLPSHHMQTHSGIWYVSPSEPG